MSNQRIFAFGVVFVLVASVASAEDGLRYRDFDSGTSVAGVAKQTGASASDAKRVQVRPAAIDELVWRPRYYTNTAIGQNDPVEQMVFSFYEDQLFRIVVDYQRDRTTGLTDADMIATISTIYGTAAVTAPVAGAGPSRLAQEIPVAVWQMEGASLTLMRASYQKTFKLVVVFTRLDDLARIARTEALRLDSLEAPQRELAQKKQDASDAVAADEKARRGNLPGFKP